MATHPKAEALPLGTVARIRLPQSFPGCRLSSARDRSVDPGRDLTLQTVTQRPGQDQQDAGRCQRRFYPG
jgi:hypothetical protein